MGDSPARMVDFDVFRTGFHSQIEAISEVQNVRLSDLTDSEIPEVASKLWRIISGLTIGIGETKSVAVPRRCITFCRT